MSKPRIRPIAICIFRHGDRILVAEKLDEVKGETFARPLGGGIDFGERSEQAMVREIQEELGAAVQGLKLLGILESVFDCHGKPGHEIVFVYDAVFSDPAFYHQDEIQGIEGEEKFTAVWRSLRELRSGGMRLVPETLWSLL
jgi:8-oxo-dGTP pyrophosphatase MutT (NUDIX family)